MSTNTLDRESTNNVTLKGLKDEALGTYPTDASVVLVELLDGAGSPVAGVANISMPYVSGTMGRSSLYRGAIPSTVTLVAGTVYTARVRATSNANVRMFNIPVTAQAG